MEKNLSEEEIIKEENQNNYNITNIKKGSLDDYKNSYKYIDEFKTNIPIDLKIEKYQYHYKYIKKINKEVIYRCKYANSCKVYISIDLENITKIIGNEYDENTIIYFKYNNNQKHTCEQIKENTIKKNIYKNDDQLKVLKEIIKSNPLKTLTNIKLELAEKNIYINDTTIKNYLEKIRKDSFISDNEYVNLLYKEKIKYHIKGKEIYNSIFFGSKKIYNKDKDRLENYIILSSDTQMTFLTKTNQLFIDCTFKSAPKGYYQIMNILAKPLDYNHVIPVFLVLMSNKSFYSYINIFSDIKLNLLIKKLNINWNSIYFIHDFEKGLVKAIEEYFPESKSIGCFYHYCKSLWVYAKKHQCFKKKYSKEILFILFAYKIYPFIKKKEEYIKHIEMMINNTEEKNTFLRLHNFFVKNWSKQRLLNYNEYLDNKFYDTTNNFSEAFNHAINKLININHPKISILVEKMNSYIALRINEYYEYIKENNNKDLLDIDQKEFIFTKIKNFIEKYQLLYENEVNLEQIKVLYEKNKIEIYEILIFLWIDIINDEEDEELIKIFYNINEKIKKEAVSEKINIDTSDKKKDNYIDKMTKNLTKDNFSLESREEESKENSLDIEESDINEEKNLNYYILNLESKEKKQIKIKKNFLKWELNSCRYDSLIFLFIYGIIPYIQNDDLITRNEKFFLFVEGLNKEFEVNEDISFWEYYDNYESDFLNIKNDIKEWKVENTLSSVVNKLIDINIFKTIYAFKTGVKCNHTLRKKYKDDFTFPILLSINRLNEKLRNIEDIIHDKLITFSEKCHNQKCRETYRYEFKQTSEFLFIILDYLYKDLNNNNNKKIKEKLIHYNISCFSEFYEVIGFIIMPEINHFTSILMGNINDNNEFEYYYYNDMNGGNVIKKTDTFENIVKTYKIHLIIYRHLSQ